MQFFNYLFTQTPLNFLIQPLWRDEAFSYSLAIKPFFTMVFLTAKDFNPPLYYTLLAGWMRFFGSSEIALRLPSLIFFLLTIYVSDHILAEILRIKTWRRYLYLLLIAINPILLYYAFEARMYSMFACLAAVSFYALYTKKRKLYFWSIIGGLFTHYFMVFVVLAQLGALYVAHKRTILRSTLKILVIPGIIFLLWLTFVAMQSTHSQGFWILPSELKDLIYLPAVLYTGYESTHRFYTQNAAGIYTPLLLLTGVFVLIAVYAFIEYSEHIFDREKWTFFFFLFWGVVPPLVIFGISFFKPIFLPRYIIFSAPGMVFFIIYILQHLPRSPRYIVLALLFIFTWNYHKLQLEYRTKKYPAEKLISLKGTFQPNESLYLMNELDYFVALYYLPNVEVKIYGNNYDEIPAYVGKVLIPPSAVVNQLPVYPHRAVVLEENGDVQKESIK